jgi:site-specific DNA recombinase
MTVVDCPISGAPPGPRAATLSVMVSGDPASLERIWPMISLVGGCRAQDRKLIIVDSEAEIVRFIFRRYAELGSVRLLKDELEARSIHSRLRTSASGRISGGKPFARGALYLMLQNRIYRGEIVHNKQSYPGEHAPIIDQPLWNAVQAQIASTAAQRNDDGKTQPSLLAGMLFDGDGNRMTPSHAVKKNTRYRYYVSRSLITRALST